ncbi:ATP-binding protein [Hydrogenophaga sp.]|uniref:ATP-binding protein n=1 Tax=Hydrogenophaga sp. TaxID=1904254 RepID=UPI0025BF5FDF|nr:ATP-binding protein [Hydrogenophaga sp.]MBT9463038.1 response regulator [Hydrogenophaga sp.]
MKQWMRLRLKPQSIRSRLILLVLAILLPSLVAGLWVVGLTFRLARDTNERHLEDTARALSMVLDLELAKRSGVVRGLALSRMLDAAPNIAPGTLRAFDEQARRTLTGLEGWLEMRSADRVFINTRLTPGELPRSLATGALVPLVDTPQILPLRESEQLGIYHAALVQPVLREGRAVLNLTLTVMPHEFQRIIDQQKINEQWVAAILDSEGRLVARHPGGAAHAGRYATEELRQRLSTEREGLLHTKSLEGNDITIFFSTSAQGWTYVTGMPTARFEGVVPEDVRNAALATLLMLTLAIAAALGVSRSIVRPIHAIKQLALGMRDGGAVHADATGITECDDVAQALERASVSIRGAQVELEQRVAEAVALTRNAEQRMSHSHRLEALGRLTGGVAHDFNNLLGVISNSAHLMLRMTSDPEFISALEASLRAVGAGSRLTQHLSRFAGRQPVRPCVIHLAIFLPEAADLIRALMGRHIKLTVVIDPSMPTLFADPNELELALINLALNARDAIAERGHVELRTLRAEPDDCAELDQEDCVVVSVTDDGHGMGEDIIKRVFEPFFSTKDHLQATGLGLSQVYGFCHQSGGTVRINSTPGLGTTVSMVLPASGASEPAVPPTGARPSIIGARVLLVDDNEELRGVTAALLATFGCEVISSPSPQEALRILQNNGSIDVVLTDVLMPGPMDGVALAKQVRELMPALPVVLISGHRGNAEDLDFPFIQKPCTPEALVAALEKAMALQREGCTPP